MSKIKLSKEQIEDLKTKKLKESGKYIKK